MIKMSEILKLDSLKYADYIPKKHLDKMNGSLGIFNGFDVSQYLSYPPYKNSSNATYDEICSLDSIPMDVQFIKKADDVKKYFKQYFDSVGIQFPDTEVDTLMEDSQTIILKLKYHYNRPRPSQVANSYGLNFNEEPLGSAKTPAYPSGHSTQGILIAKFLAAKYPKHSDNIMKLGNDISKSRLSANIHYPSDSTFGEKLGLALYSYITDKL